VCGLTLEFSISLSPTIRHSIFLPFYFLSFCTSVFLPFFGCICGHTANPRNSQPKELIILFLVWVSRGVGEPVYVCVCGLTLEFSISLPSYYPSLYLCACRLPIFLHLCLLAFPCGGCGLTADPRNISRNKGAYWVYDPGVLFFGCVSGGALCACVGGCTADPLNSNRCERTYWAHNPGVRPIGCGSGGGGVRVWVRLQPTQ
jgi:hypothetical protein